MANKLVQLTDGSDNIFTKTMYAALSSSNNLDDVTTEGTYWCNTVGGRPQTTNTNAFLLVQTYGTNILQTYIPYATTGIPNIYMRYASGGTWRAWKKIATESV